MTPVAITLMLQAVASGAMCGIIWFVQIVHYPLFGRRVHDETSYARENQTRTGRVVIPFMLVEGLTAAVLAWAPPPGVPRWATLAGLTAVIALWISTLVVQMPLHARLAREGHATETVAALVRSNWPRTLAWTGRAALAAWMLHAAG